MYPDSERKPAVFDAIHILIAVVLHVVLFGGLWLIGVIGTEEESDEEVIPIECLVVVHENLDGDENDEPPERDVVKTETPPPTPPPPPDPPVVTPPRVPEDNPFVVEPPKPPKPPEPPKPTEVKKPDPPKPPEPPKPPKPTREEILARIRGETTIVKSDPPKHNGRTERRPTNWDRLLAAGARPSNRNRGLDATEEQRCAGLIKAAFYEKWHPRPPWTMDLKKMTLHVEFDKQGRVKAFRLTGSSGDAAADRTVLSAARSVGRVSGLTAAYLERHPTSTIIFEVEPQ